MLRIALWLLFFAGGFFQLATAQTVQLQWQDPPLNNPLRGLVPYQAAMPELPNDATADDTEEFENELSEIFPHSVEFRYMSLRALMTGENEFDWSPVEDALNQTQARHCQSTLRVFLEYPGNPIAIPQFLIDGGLKVKPWKSDDGQIHTPDYEDEKLRAALRQFIAAYGQRYDGDSRLAWLTVGTLGLWGEWHNYPKEELFASQPVQGEVLAAWEKAFPKTKHHLRYPAGPEDEEYVANDQLPFGYHDDSFAFATIPTGRNGDSWFYGALLERAGQPAMDKWKTQPIGGEIRPEVWGCIFDSPGCQVKGQEFVKCVEYTHATWLMDSGMFNEKPSKQRFKTAAQRTARLGYQLTIQSATRIAKNGASTIELTVSNRGVAPFYYDWPVETVVLNGDRKPIATLGNEIHLSDVLPGKPATWQIPLSQQQGAAPDITIGIRVPNPMSNGHPLRFANKEQSLDADHWLVIDFKSTDFKSTE